MVVLVVEGKAMVGQRASDGASRPKTLRKSRLGSSTERSCWELSSTPLCATIWLHMLAPYEGKLTQAVGYCIGNDPRSPIVLYSTLAERNESRGSQLYSLNSSEFLDG